MSKARLMQGNEACAEGAIAAGVNFFAEELFDGFFKDLLA